LPSQENKRLKANDSSLQLNAEMLEKTLADFGVQGKIIEVQPGPVVTLYSLEPSPGTKSSRVIGLADDIARSMSATAARISVISGQNAIGIELPNSFRETVFLKEMLQSDDFKNSKHVLPLALGKDIAGKPVIIDLAKTPHLLVAGTTGSGKSVGINAMILSLLYKYSPDECKFIMIDPKMLELSIYQDIPHLLTPVVTEPSKAIVALKWIVKEMENRYRLMSNLNVRNMDGYNKKIEEAKRKGQVLTRKVQTGYNPNTGEPIIEEVNLDMNKLPFIVLIVDEMADLMLVAGKEIEASIQRLAQMARAAGIHIILATQRPSVDVITGVIKANFPSRISFMVTSKIDSRTILGEQGAEQLLGMGDMLYMASGTQVTRIHGPFVSDNEVEAVVKHIKSQARPNYIADVTTGDNEDMFAPKGGSSGEKDAMFDEAVAIVIRDGKVSTSYIQRVLRIGYNRAANIVEQMEKDGIISAADHSGKREVLLK
jgi:S-DNA-T family DNA segregation ATPase FtsK/SpoIIIE